ncbi:MAG TPA: tripartite tricarboxylate transporter TctB family protein [Syntrophorhabdales bacterium]|nr:tripartite tricarboxylate transporter TctB family protein [Syntrophorhabdales bacterium]
MMKKDLRSSLVWLAAAIAISIESSRLGLGTLHSPGPGLYPFSIGIIMIFLSAIIAGSSLIGHRESGDEEEAEENANTKDLLLVLVALFLYAIFLERLGFLLSTGAFILFILKVIEKKKWYIAVFFAVVATALIYVVFNLWLDSNLPRGILGP